MARGFPKGYKQSEEHKRKIGDAHRGKKKNYPIWNKGLKGVMPIPWNKGKGELYSKEMRKRMGDSHRGIKFSKERREKMSEARKGKPMGSKNYRWKGGISIGENKKKYQEEYNKNHRDERRNKILFKTYGITQEQYNQMFVDQNGLCAICGGSQNKGKYLEVDHNHITGKNRGLLCHLCNVGLGSFKDNEDNLIKAIKYLQRSSSK